MTMQFRHLPPNGLQDDGVIDGTISDAAILVLRRWIWSGGMIDAAQADEVLTLNEAVLHPSEAWTAFFVEAIAEFLMDTSTPRGFLSEAQADWLILRLDRDGRPCAPAKLELLVHLLEKMDAAPDRMKAYILAQIERSIGSGECGIDAGQCALLRRVIFAPAGYGPARVSAEEAEMLFRIKDATLGADNAPEWQALFVQGVANYLQGWQGLAMPTAEQELAHERFLTARDPGIGGVLGQTIRTSANGLVSAVRGGGFGRRSPARDYLAEERADYAVTPEEKQWLDAQIAADRKTDPLEQALLAFLRDDRGTGT
jgi:hypothetical protein